MNKLALASATTLLALAACAEGPRPDRPAAAARLAPRGPSPWREDLADPVLRQLLAEADAGDLDVKLALARLERAEADVAAARADLSPEVTVGGDAATGGRSLHSATSAATPALAATYELDLWGRLAAAASAASHDRSAAEADVAAARLLVGAETARAYVALCTAERAEGTAEHRRALAERALVLTELRAREGVAGADELASRRQALSEAEVRRRGAQAEAALQRIRLGALLGRSEPASPPVDTMPSPPDGGPIASSELIDGRPDVQAALARLAAADQRRAVAVAASRPQFQITAALGAPDAAVAVLLDSGALAWAAAASLTHTLFDAGANRARIHAADAEADAADIGYRKAVLQGWTELRGAIVDTAAAQDEAAQAQAALAAADRSLARGEMRHQAGTLDGLALGALDDQAAAAVQASDQARARWLDARVRLALAAGGR